MSRCRYVSRSLISAAPGNRVASQSFGYDLRGNVITSTDDANDLWDRSLGTAGYQPGTDQWTTTSGGGSASYDASGNLTTATTATGIVFELRFDELGRLSRAVREDPSGTVVSESYAYDAKGERVITDKTPAYSAPDQYLVNVFDSLVLKGASFPDANGDYQHDDSTEQLYLTAGGSTWGRAFYDTTLPTIEEQHIGGGGGVGDVAGGVSLGPPDGGTGAPIVSIGTGDSGSPPANPVHVFVPMRDPLGSTSFVIDQNTGELVEAVSYQPYGGVDSDYRPTRWNTPREDMRFTGQWDVAEVGLVYMHARYYSPDLGRFISADPRTIQAAASGTSPYAYAGGSPMRYADPTGLFDPNDPNYGTGYYESLDYLDSPDESTGDSPLPPPPPAPAPGYGVSTVGSVAPIQSSSGGVVAVAFDQDAPTHAGALVYGENTSTYTDYFPAGAKQANSLYIANLGTTALYPNFSPINLDANGAPTAGSLSNALAAVLSNQGHARGLAGVIIPNLDTNAALGYAQASQENPPNYQVLAWGFGNENCTTYVDKLISAAGGPASLAVAPSALLDQPSFASYPNFTYYPEQGIVFGPSQTVALPFPAVPPVW
jgi:RHS repeat-associated protein